MQYYRPAYSQTFLDLRSIRCVVDDAERDWKSVAVEAGAYRAIGDETPTISGNVQFYGKDGKLLTVVRMKVPAGETATASTPLESLSPEDIYSAKIFLSA
jgi:hypothetical protein